MIERVRGIREDYLRDDEETMQGDNVLRQIQRSVNTHHFDDLNVDHKVVAMADETATRSLHGRGVRMSIGHDESM
jgi:hypothetical protein